MLDGMVAGLLELLQSGSDTGGQAAARAIKNLSAGQSNSAKVRRRGGRCRAARAGGPAACWKPPTGAGGQMDVPSPAAKPCSLHVCPCMPAGAHRRGGRHPAARPPAGLAKGRHAPRRRVGCAPSPLCLPRPSALPVLCCCCARLRLAPTARGAPNRPVLMQCSPVEPGLPKQCQPQGDCAGGRHCAAGQAARGGGGRVRCMRQGQIVAALASAVRGPAVSACRHWGLSTHASTCADLPPPPPPRAAGGQQRGVPPGGGARALQPLL